jgi:hypothetical protein
VRLAQLSRLFGCYLAVALNSGPPFGQAAIGQTASGLADTTVLVIRHAEKPASGPGLAPAGVARAAWYPTFFRDLRIDGHHVHINSIFATADSKGSARERLTVEPLAKTLGLPVDLRFKNKAVADLVDALRAKAYGPTILICWHHGRIPEMLSDLGADAGKLLPEGKWPGDSFDRLVELHFDHAGKLAGAKVEIEPSVGTPR